jgi:hypothetical protein
MPVVDVSFECISAASQEETFLVLVLPPIKSLSSRIFRKLPPSEREEAEAAATALGWVMYLALVSRGKDPAKFRKRFAVGVVSRVCEGRLVGSRMRCHDPFSRAARRRYPAMTVHYLGCPRQSSDADWQQLLVEKRNAGPAETAAVRLDFEAWLSRMPARRRRIAESLATGSCTRDVARQFNVSSGRISQIRNEFFRSWLVFQGEPVCSKM